MRLLPSLLFTWLNSPSLISLHAPLCLEHSGKMRSELPHRFFDPHQESQEQEPCNSHNCDFTAVDGLHLLIFCTGSAVLKHQFRPYFFLSKNLFKTEVLLASLSLPTPIPCTYPWLLTTYLDISFWLFSFYPWFWGSHFIQYFLKGCPHRVRR